MKQQKQRDLSCHYSLRKNPKKKTQESPESMKKILFRCEECGKGFRYEKCLSNHQETHLSTKQKEKVYEEEEEEPMKSLLSSSFSGVTKKKRSRVNRYKKTPLSCSTFLETHSVSAENDEELEVAESLILLSKSGSPKFVDGLKLVAEAIDANNPETPKGSYDSGCLSNKKQRKAGEFEYGFVSNEQKLVEDRSSSYETSKGSASFLGDNTKMDQKLLEEGISSDETSSFLGRKTEQKLRKGGEFGTGFSSNEQKAMEESVSRYESESEHGVVGAMECAEMVPEANEENVEHQCKLCKKIFSSYQALGGHQTFHRISKSKSKKHYKSLRMSSWL
ncbi:hypothetical protein AALP_AA8G160900 [Arabis alpina]|uniref:C2H2-type domain-containing protein n=1 Tax=Arabis alpina TaxID=50452 RepID=A0A087G7D9_ARAAL|nr:hypothetical protein AALP_AA8G160900 [Arabis alpina]